MLGSDFVILLKEMVDHIAVKCQATKTSLPTPFLPVIYIRLTIDSELLTIKRYVVQFCTLDVNYQMFVCSRFLILFQ